MNRNKQVSPSSAPGGFVLRNALLGAFLGGTITAFKNIGKVKNGEMTKEDAVKDSLIEAGTFGVSTGTASAVVAPLPLGPVTSALGFVAVASGTKYMLNKVVPGVEETSPALEEVSVEEAPSKAKAKKIKVEKSESATKPKKTKKTPKKTKDTQTTEKTEEN